MPKIKCPSGTHEDNTPSCEVYSNGTGFCFSCDRYFPKISSDLIGLVVKKPKEDLSARLAYIASLPKREHRGLEFHFDMEGYYVMWPKNNYYKCRKWHELSGSKYLGPRGHKQPLFYIQNRPQTRNLIIVEGEINALSLNRLNTEFTLGFTFDVLSPGGVSSFTDQQMRHILPEFARYKAVAIFADADQVGAIAALNLKELILPYVPNVALKLFHKPYDCNKILVERGTHGLREEIKALAV